MDKYISGLVSVVIPTYRRANMLTRAIDSVLTQTYQKIELLVVNDNEPDDENTLEVKRIISTFDDKRLILVEQERHINGAAARNAGIKRATGEYVAFLDDDDYWEYNKIEIQVNTLSKLGPEWGGVSTLKKIYNNQKMIMATLPYKSDKIYEEILLRRIEVSTSTILLRHEALDDTGYFDESLKRHQELQLLANFTYKYKIKLIKRFLHNGDLSDNQNRPDIEKLKIIKLDFFKSVKPIINALPRRKQRRIYIMHDFELGYAMLRNKQYSDGIKKCIKVFRSPITTYYAIERSLTRIIGTKFRNIIVKNNR